MKQTNKTENLPASLEKIKQYCEQQIKNKHICSKPTDPVSEYRLGQEYAYADVLVQIIRMENQMIKDDGCKNPIDCMYPKCNCKD